jgi:hypothetical protein
MSPYVFFGLLLICAGIGSYLGPKRERNGVSIKQAIRNSEENFARPISKDELRKLHQKNLILLLMLVTVLILLTLIFGGEF